jgi:predicted metal-dependent phosphoesterase TrpH
MIDLHLHTTASDGRSTPERLIARVASRGIRICAITDHDTVAALERARGAGERFGVRVVAGIEITAVTNGADVHMLGYFFDPAHEELVRFLAAQRDDRRRRVFEMLDRLEGLGIVLPREPIFAKSRKVAGKAIGRPAIARALVAHGHARDVNDAFERFLAIGRPAFIPRRGASPADVVHLIARAGGVSSFAHPGKLGLDDHLAPLAAAGLTAIEVFHPDHDAAAVEKYGAIARSLGLAVSGGSDYHGQTSSRVDSLGQVTLPAEAFEELWRRAPRLDPAA